LGLRQQGKGNNRDTWGDDLLNLVLRKIDRAIRGVFGLTLTGDRTITNVGMGETDERAYAVHKLTDGGLSVDPTVTYPANETTLFVWNTMTRPTSYKHSGGGAVTAKAGALSLIVGDGTTMRALALSDLAAATQTVDFGGFKGVNLAAPTANTDAATKKYVDDTAFTMAGGGLPAQSGNAGRFLSTTGSVAEWRAPKQIFNSDVTWLTQNA
jgi:hypothetical protein